MKNTLQLKKQLRARRRKQSKRQTLSLEQLEPKKLLTASDYLGWDIELAHASSTEENQIYPFQHSANSYAYNASEPSGAPAIQSEGLAAWTPATPSSLFSAVEVSARIINTVQDFHNHLAAGQVAEVSDNLIGNFYNAQDNALYPSTLQRAWAFSSDNLYTLLVLNSRDPGQTLNDHGQLDPNGTYHITNKVMQAMMRIVGFGFTGNLASNGGVAVGNEYYPAPGPVPGSGDVPFPNTFKSNLCVFDKYGTFETTNPAGDIVHARGLDIQVPTVRRFFEFTNDPINGRGLTGIGSPGLVQALPNEVYRRLESLYREAIPNSQNPQGKNSIEIFAEISGIDNLQKLLMYPDTVYEATNPGSVHPMKGDAGGTVYDAYNVPLNAPFNTSAIISSNYVTYKEACDAIRGYYTSSGDRTQLQVRNFFSNFADSRLKNITSGDNPDKNYNDLVIGFRALMALSYDASPFWTSYGIGFSNGANPLVGANLDAIQQPDRFIDLFNGQEIQLENIYMPTGFLDIPALDMSPLPLIGTNLATFDNYTTDGWFALNSPTPISGVDNYYDPTSEIYQDNYKISTSGTAILFNSSSTSSDTVSAAEIPTEGVQVQLLQPDTLITLGSNPPVRLDSIDPVLVDTGSLPANFATYISLAGGVDRVTGSGLDDVIVGPSKTAAHGRLTVNAGAGHDIVAPGRGGSLVQLGAGADTVVFDVDDLFGEANFLDFNFGEGDRIRLGAGIHTEWSPFNPDTITLHHRLSGAKKVLRLTPMDIHGDNFWHEDTIAFSSPHDYGQTDNASPVALSYIETHQWVIGNDTSLNDVTMTIRTTDSKPTNLANLIVSLGTTSKSFAFDTSGVCTVEFTEHNGFGSLTDWIGQISITPIDSLDSSTANGNIPNKFGFGGRQIQVFVTRPNADTNTKTSLSPELYDSLAVRNSTFYLPVGTYEDGYQRLESGQGGDGSKGWSPHTQWTYFKQADAGDKYTVAYLGGLARILLKNRDSSKHIQISLDQDFPNGVGFGGFNLSSRMAIWPNLTLQQAQQITTWQNDSQRTNKIELHPLIDPKQGGLSFDPPTQLKTLATSKKIIVNGLGRIHTFNVNTSFSTQFEAPDPFYWINSDMLTASSTYKSSNQSDPSQDAAVDVSGITTAWALKRGTSAVILQDFNNTVTVTADSGNDLLDGNGVIDLTPTDTYLTGTPTSFAFAESPVLINDYKHVGNFVSATDGPDIMGPGSKITNSFMHVNDDAIKIRAPGFQAESITLLQGNGGSPVGYGYGFINGNVQNSEVRDVFVHRIFHNGKSENHYGLVGMRIVPNPDWTYRHNFGPTSVRNVYVPDLQGIANTDTVANSIGYHTTLTISHQITRGTPTAEDPTFFAFAPFYDGTHPNYTFTVENVSSGEGFNVPDKEIIHTDPTKGHLTKSYFQLGPFIPNTDHYSQPKMDSSGNYGFKPFPFPLEKSDRSPSDTIVIVKELASAKVNFGQSKVISRPILRRSTKFIIDGLNGVMGPSPVQLTYSLLVDASLHQSGGSAAPLRYVVSNVASGHVEKKRSDGSWVDVSTPPKTSNPRALLQLLQNRMITPSDEIRWVPGTANEGKASAEAFSLYGWDGVSASVEASEIEVGVE